MQQVKSNRGTTRYARILAVSVLIGGFSSTLFMAKSSRDRHDSEIMRVFQAESDSMRNAVSRQVDLFFAVLDSIGQLHDLSDRISAEDFEEFASKGMNFQRRILSAYGFVQRVPHELRIEIEREGVGGLRIVEPGVDEQYVAAGVRPEYFPLVYQNPENALALPLGMDMAALPGVAESIVHLYRDKSPVITSSLRMQDVAGSTGHFVFSPLYQRTADGREYLSGFTVSVFWPGELLDRALADVATRDVLIRFYHPDLHQAASNDRPEKFEVSAEVMIADSAWKFQTRASKEYLASRHTIVPGLILVTGFAITVLLSAMIWQLAGRTRRIEHVVTERTRDLQSANQLLSEAMQERMRLEHEILEISEREKQLVGQDLHDSLGQKLTGAVFLSRALAAHLSDRDEETRSQATRINEILKESVAQVRRMARGLSPVDLGDEGLVGALRRLTEETSSVYGITCLYHQAEGARAASATTAHHLYAIALEAVTNAVRHGKATEIVMEFGRHHEQGMLAIEDNGCGFDNASTQRGGMGMRIMKYRATMIGGHLEITRRPSGGMEVMCVFPAAAG